MADGAAQKAAFDGKVDLEVLRADDFGRGLVNRRRVAFWLGGQQLAGVGVLRIGEEGLGGIVFDDLAVGHYIDAVGHVAHDAEVVGDQQDRHAEAGLQVLEQSEDLRLDRHVEGGGRLVGDQQVGLVGQGHGDHYTLALAARELVRPGVEALFDIGQADQLQ